MHWAEWVMALVFAYWGLGAMVWAAWKTSRWEYPEGVLYVGHPGGSLYLFDKWRGVDRTPILLRRRGASPNE